MSYLFAFSYCSWGYQGKNTEVVCHSFLQWTTFCQTSPPWPDHLGWPHTAWLSFIELDKALVRVIRLASCLWLWFQSVCPLMPSLRAYRHTWFSLTLNVEYLFMAAPAKRSLCSLPRAWGGSSRPHLCMWQPPTLVRRHSCQACAPSQPDGRHRNQIDYILCSQRWRSSI